MKKRAAPEPVRILLIEDDASFVYLLRRALDADNFHYELTILDDGAKALAFFRKQGKYAHEAQPDLIVMDLHLPKSDGIEILEEIRGSAAFGALPVAVLSSVMPPEEKNRMEALKATCFITKPQDLDEFSMVGKRIRQLAIEGKAKAAP